MATTIKSTDLDFDNIRNSLKTFLSQQEEFSDYNFEGSAISSILDVLAYNTHHNALMANFALNESFLSTAQLRSSLVSLAGGLGYIVSSRSASFGLVNLFVTNNQNPTTMTMPAGFTFTSKVDNKTYTFKTRETLTAYNNGSNQYFFGDNGNLNVSVYEGVERKKTFVAGPSSENDVYVIPVNNLDINTVKVRVYEDPSSSSYYIYKNIVDESTINSNSRIYVIKESPNGYYELTFGNGVRLGTTPTTGSKIEVVYDVVSGPEANGARSFYANSTLNGFTVNVITVSPSIGGTYKEDIDSIRKNAPYQYAAQNRMVTADDYSTIILRKYSNLIEDIKSWGGEDNLPPKYGTVFVSIEPSTSDQNVLSRLKSDITTMVKDFSVVSFNVEFVDPEKTYIQTTVRFQFNPKLTSLSQSNVEANVKNTIVNYFEENLGKFDSPFRRSNLLTEIDETEASVLSSRADIKMIKRIQPTQSTSSITINFPTELAIPDDDVYTITSENFIYRGKVCSLRNRLSSNVIEIVDASSGSVVLNNLGSYNNQTGQVFINSFNDINISGDYLKVYAVPLNQSTINASRNNILELDPESSVAVAVLIETV